MHYLLVIKLGVKMIRGGIGGANTQTGIRFEKKHDILEAIAKIEGYTISNNDILFNGQKVAEAYKKAQIYTKFLTQFGIIRKKIDGKYGVYIKTIDDEPPKKILSKSLEPDNSLFIINSKTIHILELKDQSGQGSVDEKLQTCNFKKQQYEKLFGPFGIKVEFTYLLADWFKDKKYEDSLEYIKKSGCHYFFDHIDLSHLELPTN